MVERVWAKIDMYEIGGRASQPMVRVAGGTGGSSGNMHRVKHRAKHRWW